jgi:hypothetical protein
MKQVRTTCLALASRFRIICILPCACLLFGSVAIGQVSSGLDSAEGSEIYGCDGTTCGSTPFDSLWADSSVQRWRMNNHAINSPETVAQWPCVHGGCIPYADTTAVSTVFPEKELPIGAQGSMNGTCSYAQCISDAHGSHPRAQSSTSCMCSGGQCY